MQETDLISLGAGAQWLSAQTGRNWTPALLIDRLLARGGPGVCALLPRGWALLSADDGEPTRLARASVFRVADGEDFLEQFAMFGDLSIAGGIPGRLVDAAGRGFRSVAPIPAAMLRLMPEELHALAAAAGARPAATFMRRVAQMRAQAHDRSRDASGPDAGGSAPQD
ncbi:hypothetical protein [Thauera sinica]|uniref:Cyclic nucleotide-binding domain-containing protein n=1 Tax=Thauera sinica TaxID=2665146 RepID=A0ABW1AT06_9RHOO|nr:hypothetical protein [Thauera sp. K11]ATE58974.1 hypothetical protein CCZ27_02465 [Thauera sp. K11]